MGKGRVMSPQAAASEVVKVFPRGRRGSLQNIWRSVVVAYVEAGFGRNAQKHGLPRDINALLDAAFTYMRIDLGEHDFLPVGGID